jgi:hypothetical protein
MKWFVAVLLVAIASVARAQEPPALPEGAVNFAPLVSGLGSMLGGRLGLIFALGIAIVIARSWFDSMRAAVRQEDRDHRAGRAIARKEWRSLTREEKRERIRLAREGWLERNHY